MLSLQQDPDVSAVKHMTSKIGILSHLQSDRTQPKKFSVQISRTFCSGRLSTLVTWFHHQLRNMFLSMITESSSENPSSMRIQKILQGVRILPKIPFHNRSFTGNRGSLLSACSQVFLLFLSVQCCDGARPSGTLPFSKLPCFFDLYLSIFVALLECSSVISLKKQIVNSL